MYRKTRIHTRYDILVECDIIIVYNSLKLAWFQWLDVPMCWLLTMHGTRGKATWQQLVVNMKIKLGICYAWNLDGMALLAAVMPVVSICILWSNDIMLLKWHDSEALFNFILQILESL